MKYSAVFLGSCNNFRSFFPLVVWAVTFVISANAQEITAPTAERSETGYSYFAERHVGTESVSVPGTDIDGTRMLTLPKDVQRRFSCLELQLPANDSEQPFDTRTGFPRPDIAFRQAPIDEDLGSGDRFERFIEPNRNFGLRMKSRTDDESKSPFKGFVYSTTLPGMDEKAPLKTDDDKDDDDPPGKVPPIARFHWGPAINQSLIVLGIQHGYALAAQEKTRRALANGNFFGDYWRSVRSIQGWDDGNRFFTNYIAHPMQGGLTGFIFVQNHDRAKTQKFGDSKQYWKDRFKAFVWSTAWSTQFELGPISQSSIGNVGLYGGMGYVDLVMTPTAGTAWLVSEEAIDRYLIRHIERRSFMLKIFVRSFLNPMRAVANMLRFREPWYRDRPFGH